MKKIVMIIAAALALTCFASCGSRSAKTSTVEAEVAADSCAVVDTTVVEVVDTVAVETVAE